MKEEFIITPDAQGREAMDGLLAVTVGVGGFTLGRSILGREILAYTLGTGRRRLIYVGAHHALEGLTCNLLYGFIYRICACTDLPLLRHFRLTVVPCLNPDGIELRYHGIDGNPLAARQGRMCGGDTSTWQANARGVDLNHNYSKGFYEYKELERERGIECGASLYSGEYPESEPETCALASYIRMCEPSLVISLHSQGEQIYYYPKSKRGERLVGIAERLSGYKRVLPTDTDGYGGLCDYTDSLGIPSLTLEVGKGKNPLPITDCREIFPRIFPILCRLPLML